MCDQDCACEQAVPMEQPKMKVTISKFVLDVEGTEVELTRAELYELLGWDQESNPYIMRRFENDEDLLRALVLKLVKQLN